MRGVYLFGGHHAGYPRSAVILEGLRRLGVPVADCTASPRRKVVRRYASLVQRYASLREDFEILFVPEFRHKDVPLASVLARWSGRRVVFDPLVSRFDTRVRDRGDARERGLQAWHNRNLDRLSMGLADAVLADTDAHAEYYARELAPPDARIRVLRVGYDDGLFRPAGPEPAGATLRVLFYGSFLPLHGADVIVGAAARLRGEDRVRIEMIGDGQTLAEARRLAAQARLDNLTFTPRVSPEELPVRIAGAAICLGIFGATPKAGRVIPNKIYQCMGMERAVVTGNTPAVRELFTDGADIVLTPPGDADGLAESIRRLARNQDLRRRIARAAGERARRDFSPVPIAARFLEICEETLAR